MSDAVTIDLPKEKVAATRVVPNNLIMYGPPKCGKTTIASELPNNLIIEVEKNGADFVDALKISPPEGLGPVALFKWMRDVAKKIKDDGRPYDFVTIDTFSEL